MIHQARRPSAKTAEHHMTGRCCRARCIGSRTLGSAPNRRRNPTQNEAAMSLQADSSLPTVTQLVELHADFLKLTPKHQDEARRRALLAAKLLVEERSIAEKTAMVVARNRKLRKRLLSFGFFLMFAPVLFGFGEFALRVFNSESKALFDSPGYYWAWLLGFMAVMAGAQLDKQHLQLLYSSARKEAVARWDALGVERDLPEFLVYYYDLYPLLDWRGPKREESELAERVAKAIVESVLALEEPSET